jgi:cell division protein FtsN
MHLPDGDVIMPNKNYNRRTKINSPQQRKQRLAQLLWLALAILIVIFLFELVKPLAHRLTTHHPQVVTLSIPKKTDATQTPAYDFYKALPKMSMQSLTNENLKKSAAAIKVPTSNNKPSAIHSYTLQIASVRDVDQATQLATKINALNNLNGYAAKVTMLTRNKTPWYTVRLGPFSTRADAEDMQNKLDRHYFSGMILVNSTQAST